MHQILAYINANHKTHITAEELAHMAGYSHWHFCRLFAQETGLPVMAYIAKHRVDGALMEIAHGRKGMDVAAEYGFDTYAGFYKAFTRMYGCSPKKYLAIYGGYQPKQSGGFTTMQTQEIRNLLTHWDIPQNLPIDDIWIMDGAKVSGNVWKIGDDYVLKTGPRDQMLRNIRITNALAAEGFTASTLLPTKDGAPYVDAARITALYHRLPGAPLSKEDRYGQHRYDFGYKYGQGLARLHRALAAVEADIMPNEGSIYETVKNWSMPRVQKQNEQWNMGLSQAFFEDYANNFARLVDKLPRQLIHTDANPSNILFDHGDISGFIDFDLSERDIRLRDVCYCATGILCEWRGVDGVEEKWPRVLEGILHGYDSINPLTAEEKEAVFYVLCAIEMMCVAYFDTVAEFQELAANNREMLQYIVSSEAWIKGLFK